MASRLRLAGKSRETDTRLFTLEVGLLNGPVTKKFLKKNKSIRRTIQMRGDQTLEELHLAIFEAFDRYDEHMYEFQVGGKGPMDPEARRYVLPYGLGDPMGEEPMVAGDVTRTPLGSLGLKKDDVFGYWFDFGDDWWHQVDVVEIAKDAGRGKYPRITERVGESPPQYLDPDEEDD